MHLGNVFNSLYDAASEKTRQAANSMMSSAKAVGSFAVTSGATVGRGVVAVAEGVANVGSFSTRALVGAVPEALQLSGEVADLVIRGPYLLAKKEFSRLLTPKETAVEQCPIAEELAKRKRLEERQHLIANGRATGASAESRVAAHRLERNNEAIELARLSDDTYSQYGNPQADCPPPGWKRLTGKDLDGIPPDLLSASQAVIYQTPPDWPGGQKTVLAFRGTEDGHDIAVDHDQAMALGTAQYRAAAGLGGLVEQKFGSGVLVTGHSLGGGKAQAAGAEGGLRGIMFNSAGLNPATPGLKMPAPDQFLQYRTPYDPVTGVQNSPTAQTVAGVIAGIVVTPFGVGMKAGDAALKALGVAGLTKDQAAWADRAAKLAPRGVKNLWANGAVAPPAIGTIVEVPALYDSGDSVLDLDLMGQHSIKSVVNGIEEQKSEDVATLRNG